MFVSLATACRRNLCCRFYSEIASKQTPHTSTQGNSTLFNGDFTFYPAVFNVSEQKILLAASLEKLDRQERRQYRKRREQYRESSPSLNASSSVQDLFLPDEYYDFQTGHYDGVIKNFREMHVTSWSNDIPELSYLLHRIRTFHPEEDTQTHLLHLASDGDIRPHRDHISAFGSWILGVSLGADRILRLEKIDPDGTPPFDIILPSGSVYVQKDTVRYDYKHSILERGILNGQEYSGGQRLSIMIRNRQHVQNL